jgi:hypothetical protein
MARPLRNIPKAEVVFERPRRPVLDLEPSGPYGGWMKHPPITCKHRKIDAEKVVWAETVMCAFRCKENLNCKAYAVLMAGSKDRKKFNAENKGE